MTRRDLVLPALVVAGLGLSYCAGRADAPDVKAAVYARQVDSLTTVIRRHATAARAQDDTIAAYKRTATKALATADSVRAHPKVVTVPVAFRDDSATATAYRVGYTDGATSREPEVTSLRAGIAAYAEATARLTARLDTVTTERDRALELLRQAPTPAHGPSRTTMFLVGVLVGGAAHFVVGG